RVETFGEMSKTAAFEGLGKPLARFEDTLRCIRLAIRVEPTAQAEEVHVFFEVDKTQDLNHAQLELGLVGHSSLRVVYPVGGDIVVDVSRLPGFVDLTGARLFVGRAVIQIGRASCRESVALSAASVAL